MLYHAPVLFDPADMLASDGPIARRLGGDYEPRRPQVAMVEAVADALNRRKHLMVEAGTGVGKSFAYLLPALAWLLDDQRPDKKRRVIVSTHTIALQEQIIEKDLPLLRAVVPAEFTAVLAKGRGNYVSLRRAQRAWDRSANLYDDSKELQSIATVLEWMKDTDDGSLATLPVLDAPAVWSDVRSDSEDCLGKRCPRYKECHYQSARRRMANADLLVVNHALFFSDLAIRRETGGDFAVLPPYDAVILDEAHTIEDVAADHFGLSLSRYQLYYLLSRLHQPRKRRGLLVSLMHKIDATLLNRVVEQVEVVRAASDRFFDDLVHWQREQGRSNGRINRPAIIENSLSDPLNELSLLLARVKQGIDDEENRMEVGSFSDRARGVAATAATLLDQSLDDAVYWLDITEKGRYERVELSASPVEVGGLLRDALFNRTAARGGPMPIIMTSATLATASKTLENKAKSDKPFQHITQRLGLDDATTLLLGSPFNYDKQAQLLIEASLPDPGDPAYFDAMTPALLKHLCDSDGGAFVLFTSYQLLKKTAEWLRPRLAQRGMPMLVHGEGEQRRALLARFRHDRRSVLLGADSFWQGVDVRGENLRLVVITRLPFVVPDRPIIEARSERITLRGGNAFADYSLPEAVLKFKQGFGRLIRSKTDQGSVVVLDSRLATKPYGKRFLAALPDLPVSYVQHAQT